MIQCLSHQFQNLAPLTNMISFIYFRATPGSVQGQYKSCSQWHSENPEFPGIKFKPSIYNTQPMLSLLNYFSCMLSYFSYHDGSFISLVFVSLCPLCSDWLLWFGRGGECIKKKEGMLNFLCLLNCPMKGEWWWLLEGQISDCLESHKSST